jgi:CRP-like cAMP-binding protein
MKGLEAVLERVPLFADLEPGDLELLAGCASNVRFEAGESIYRQGDPADRFWVVRHGRVALDMYVPQRGPVTIQTLGEGDLLGWSWLVPPYQRNLDAYAQVLTRAVAFDASCLRGKCVEDPRLGFLMMQKFASLMVKTLKATQLQLMDIYGHSSRD